MRRIVWMAWWWLCMVSLLAAGAQAAEIEVEAGPIVMGHPVTLRVVQGEASAAGARVVAVHRPGSQVPRHQDIGLTSVSGTLEWIPQAAGLVRLAVEQEGQVAVRDVAVAYDGTPRAGMLVLGLAGALLVVGMGVGFRMAGRAPSEGA